ncbi:sigma-70 family RNA polymerase sigma factor [Kutzneria viridogrisea]|uniref:RNA polymerase sigma-70 region 2 domain-containing protein n=2 Tax=Kutzneria TaxID=43356 RepID=W5VYT3_9PSEU|nr:sigma-70 family RNA polymerase sigma factor [Kutzneria albida]AHH93466.1 hypothetical protein KALB_89 [Kutzneria albida DSM 43870]MBA8929148.1 RNA polymerase sigma factor (sigma-70 family) [Kutzneria viridogrisea]
MAEFSRPSAGRSEDDRALLDRLRAGDDSAFGQLFSRHADAVRRFAMQQVRDAAEAEDLTAEAFFRVLQALRRGSGPTDHVRTYLLTVARRVSWEWSARRRDVPVEDEELNRRAEPCADTSTRLAESTLITRAFTSLPERWRSVLWQVEVEGERPAVVAPHFGLSANATAALARRAREGLRAAYLQAHLSEEHGATGCRSVRDKLGAYTAGTIKGVEGRRIRAHLRGCESCQSLQGELSEVCSSLRAHAGLLLPAVGVGLAATVTHVAAGGAGVGAVTSGLFAKSAVFAARLKLVLTAGAVAAVGVFGLTIGPWLSSTNLSIPKPSSDQNEAQVCLPTTVQDSPGQPTGANGPGTAIAATQVPSAPGGTGGGQAQRRPSTGGIQQIASNNQQQSSVDQPTWRSGTGDDGLQHTTVSTDPGVTVLERPVDPGDPTEETVITGPTIMVIPVTTTTKPTPTTKPTTTGKPKPTKGTGKPAPTKTAVPTTTTTTPTVTTTPPPTSPNGEGDRGH